MEPGISNEDFDDNDGNGNKYDDDSSSGEDEETSMTNVSITGIINTLIDDADEVNVSASSDDVNVQ